MKKTPRVKEQGDKTYQQICANCVLLHEPLSGLGRRTSTTSPETTSMCSSGLSTDERRRNGAAIQHVGEEKLEGSSGRSKGIPKKLHGRKIRHTSGVVHRY